MVAVGAMRTLDESALSITLLALAILEVRSPRSRLAEHHNNHLNLLNVDLRFGGQRVCQSPIAEDARTFLDMHDSQHSSGVSSHAHWMVMARDAAPFLQIPPQFVGRFVGRRSEGICDQSIREVTHGACNS